MTLVLHGYQPWLLLWTVQGHVMAVVNFPVLEAQKLKINDQSAEIMPVYNSKSISYYSKVDQAWPYLAQPLAMLLGPSSCQENLAE